MLLITPRTSPEEISNQIKIIREQKGKEKETLALIDQALKYGHDFVINLYWEEALTYQHMYMNNSSERVNLLKMEKTVQSAQYWIEKYKVIHWYSRLYRFLGRVSDLKGDYKKSLLFYKESIKYVKFDAEPFRILELEALLCYALMMSGKVTTGYKKAKKLFNDFESTPIGKTLKKSDYQKWTIWRSGLVARTGEALLSKKINFNRKEILNWIFITNKDLSKGDFSYRIKEIKDLEEKLNLI